MEIAVIGASDNSPIVTGYLKNLHEHVTLIPISTSQEAVQEIIVRGTDLPFTPCIPFSKANQLDQTYDLILIFSPPAHNEYVIPLVKRQLKPTSVILSFQLNLSDQTLIEAFAPTHVISAVCHFHAFFRDDHTVFLTTQAEAMSRLGFTINSTNSQLNDTLVEMKNHLDFIAQTNIVGPTKNIKWSHAISIVAFNRLSSALNCSYGDILHHEIALKTAIHLADEVGRIAHKHRVDLATVGDVNFNDLIIDSDTKMDELTTIFKGFLQAHTTSESNFKYSEEQPSDIIDELIHYARMVDQPTPYIDILNHCLHFSQKAEFHENIQLFSPLVRGLSV